jgi:steroid 5-alpha reductase family enzyme
MFYGFSIAASGQWLNWSITGCFLLIALFLGSSNFSEWISSEKYPEYKKYQKEVSRFVPFLK